MSASAIARRPREPSAKTLGIPGSVDFELPPELLAGEPPEARGLARDGVRLMVSEVGEDRVHHGIFRDLPDFLEAGDLLVVNASATINASLAGWWENGPRAGEPVEVHLSTPLPGGGADDWVIELRQPQADGTAPIFDASPGERVRLGPGAGVGLVGPLPSSRRKPGSRAAGWKSEHSTLDPRFRGDDEIEPIRLWAAKLSVPDGVLAYAESHGSPIRYRYVRDAWPLAAYQTVFAAEPGSAEMPSAGRPFTRGVLDALERAGIGWTPIVLHTGVASLEGDELPYPERYRVPRGTAAVINAAHDLGRRVIAVGTTVVRALETVASADGRVHAGAGWTDLVITPERGIFSVDGILTGLHEPRSSHLAMLDAFGGREHLESTYRAAVEERYLWHEFGDVHLMLR